LDLLLIPGSKEEKAMSVTLRDIACKVNYSVTTISRTLNGCSDVSEDTKQLIKRVAQEMDSYPHVIAQSLRRRHTTPVASSSLSPMLTFATSWVILEMLSHHLGMSPKEVRYRILLS
jgi:hypothetical protein